MGKQDSKAETEEKCAKQSQNKTRVCQNHSADDAVRACAKGPCLERENDSLPSHPKRRKGKEEVRG